jgi:hypothetical protein
MHVNAKENMDEIFFFWGIFLIFHNVNSWNYFSSFYIKEKHVKDLKELEISSFISTTNCSFVWQFISDEMILDSRWQPITHQIFHL